MDLFVCAHARCQESLLKGRERIKDQRKVANGHHLFVEARTDLSSMPTPMLEVVASITTDMLAGGMATPSWRQGLEGASSDSQWSAPPRTRPAPSRTAPAG
jgi:hypothetical protein